MLLSGRAGCNQRPCHYRTHKAVRWRKESSLRCAAIQRPWVAHPQCRVAHGHHSRFSRTVVHYTGTQVPPKRIIPPYGEEEPEPDYPGSNDEEAEEPDENAASLVLPLSEDKNHWTDLTQMEQDFAAAREEAEDEDNDQAIMLKLLQGRKDLVEVPDLEEVQTQGEYPELPFELGEEFMAEIRRHLIEEEGMDPYHKDQLEEAMNHMAYDLCQMTMEDADEALHSEIEQDLVANLQPYADAQDRWEEQNKGNAADGGSGSGDPEAEIEEQKAQLAAASDKAGWGLTEGMELPEGVSKAAIGQILAWEAETRSDEAGPIKVMGYKPDKAGMHPAQVTEMLGLKGWRLGMKVHPKLAEIAGNIEAVWKQHFFPDMRRTSYDPRWRLIDSVDPNHILGIDYGTGDPEPDDPKYPRLAIENRFYQTSKFRCLHMEIALRQDGVQVLHCVMWPRREHNLPIFGCDIVAVGSQITYAIADTTPVSADGSLPPVYVDGVRLLRAQFADGIQAAELPDWGKELFSPEAAAMRPALPVEEDLIGMHFTALATTHVLCSRFLDTLAEDEAELAVIDAAHRRYCELQLKNAKTSSVLQKSFRYLGDAGDAFVARYMNEVLFNHHFHYDVDDATKEALRNDKADLGMAPSQENEEVMQEMIDSVVKASQDRPSGGAGNRGQGNGDQGSGDQGNGDQGNRDMGNGDQGEQGNGNAGLN